MTEKSCVPSHKKKLYAPSPTDIVITIIYLVIIYIVSSPHHHACVGAPDAKNLIIQPNTADRLRKHAHGAGGGVTVERGVVPLPLAQTARAHIALPGWGSLSTELAF